MRILGALMLVLFLAGCGDRKNAVSGTIEVDEAHVGPRMAGRVEKIFAQEGDRLHEGQLIAQLEASELRARKDLAAAQIDTAIHDADAQAAQLEFLRSDATRQADLLKRKLFRLTTPSELKVRPSRSRKVLKLHNNGLRRRMRNWLTSMRNLRKCKFWRRWTRSSKS
jgi:multidrug efflux pump subunit AcrA (membrane-fusion protein)